MSDEAVIVFAHGARDAAWRAPLERICVALRQRRPDLRVELAFLELMEPSIGDMLDRLAAEKVARVCIVPAFMAQGGHLKRDLPLVVNAALERNPGLRISIVPAMGESDIVIGAIADYAAQAVANGSP